MSYSADPSGRMPPEISAEIAAREHNKLPRGLRVVDVTACVLLFVVQFGVAFLALMSFMVLPMSTDNCAYQTCGDEKWIDYAMWIALASMAPAALFSGLAIVQLARNKIESWLPLVGTIAQCSILYAAWRLAVIAGPISG